MTQARQVTQAHDQPRKAILVVSFGTSYAETRTLTIDACEQKIAAAFPEYHVRHAFTSKIIIKILKERDHLLVDTPDEALQKLHRQGFTEVIVQPLHLITGEEFHDVVMVAAQYTSAFTTLHLGQPLLSSVDDYLAVVAALKTQIPALQPDEAVVFVGHGSKHPANSAYGCLQYVLQEQGLTNVLIGTIEGYPEFPQVVKQLHLWRIRKVTLMPLMLVAGDHAHHDLAGDNADSWQNRLIEAGFIVETYLHGLGENPAIQAIYLQHARTAAQGGNLCVR